MGTSGAIKIYDNDELILSLYNQYDSYTEGLGKDLKDFINSGKFVNGISMTKEKQFNSTGCFALQLVCKLKDGVGGVYATTGNDKQDYNYSIYISHDFGSEFKVEIKCDEDKSFNEVLVNDYQKSRNNT